MAANGNSREYSAFIGGSGFGQAYDIAVDLATSTAFVTGLTNSSQSTFPDGDVNFDDIMPAPGCNQIHGGAVDAFAAKVAANGLAITYSSFIGGSGVDRGHDIAVDRGGRAVTVGETNSTQSSFPVFAGPDSTQNGGNDAWGTKLGCDPRNVGVSVSPAGAHTLQESVTRGGAGLLRQIDLQSAHSSNVQFRINRSTFRAPPLSL